MDSILSYMYLMFKKTNDNNRVLKRNYLNEIDFILLDLREPSEYDRIHIVDAQCFPAVNITRDKFTQQMIMMKNKPGKMIILYHTDERNGIPFANNFYQKGYDNVYFLYSHFRTYVCRRWLRCTCYSCVSCSFETYPPER